VSKNNTGSLPLRGILPVTKMVYVNIKTGMNSEVSKPSRRRRGTRLESS